jgi:hypothetical protein
VVRQYLRTVKARRRPSAALVKATLLHAACYRPERHASASDGRTHDFAQGWGHLNLARLLRPSPPVSVNGLEPSAPDGRPQVRWYDNVRGLATGSSMYWSCWVEDTGVPLAITLAWTDYPGNAGHYPNLVNDLDLVVTSPSGQVYYGNGQLGQAGGTPDRLNNVERVIIPQPEAGRYRIRVRAFNVPAGPQDFALVYSGGIR